MKINVGKSYREGRKYNEQPLVWRAWAQYLYRCHRVKRFFTEGIPMWAAWHLPARVRMWATIKSVSEATTGEWGNTVPSELDVMTMLERSYPKGA